MNAIKKEEIFTDLYNKKINAVRWFCRRYANEHEAEELAHDIFLRLFNDFENFRHECSLSTWLYVGTKNVCNNFMRYKTVGKRKGLTYSINGHMVQTDKYDGYRENPWTIDAHNIDSLRQVEGKELVEIVKKEISKLPKTYQECFTAFIEPDGFSTYEMASKRMNVPVGSVRSRLGRARVYLKERIRKHGSIV